MFPGDPVVASTISNPNQLFEVLGTFWQDYLEDENLLMVESWAKLQLHADVYLRAIQVAANQSVHQITPFMARQWRLITLLQSELSQAPNMIKYGAGLTYGDGHVYGQIQQNSFAFPVPNDIRYIGLMLDNVLLPTYVFDASNSTFDVVNGIVNFAVNPFTVLPSYPVYDSNGNVIDQQVLLFARNVQQDENIPYLQFGAVLGLDGVNGPSYVETVEAVWDMLVKGPSVGDLTRGIMSAAGLSYTQGNETVQVVQVDDEGLCICTDQRVYRFGANATAVVTVGQYLVEGQQLTDTIQILEFGLGQPNIANLPGLVIDQRMAKVNGPIIFPNLNTHYTYSSVNGHAEARFTLFGAPADIEAFWEQSQANGLANGKTLAQAIGLTGGGQVIAVNPLSFLTQYILGANLLVVVAKPHDFLAFQPGFDAYIKRLLPAGTLLITHTTLDSSTDGITLVSPETVDSVTACYTTIPASDGASISGYSLSYGDYTPIVNVT